MKTQLPRPAFVIFLMFSLILNACGAIAQGSAPTVTNTSAPTLTPTITLTPTQTPIPTATPNLAATQQYDDFLALVQEIYDAGQMSTTEGTYKKLDDYSDQLAMSFGYQWAPTGLEAKDFIIRADFDWEVANQKNYSGCGYLFRQDLTKNIFNGYYYIVALDGLNGVLFSYTGTEPYSTTANYTVPLVKKNKKPDMGSNPYHAEFMLVVNGAAAYTYVNGDLFTEHRLKGDWLTESGPLSNLVLTGSATDYGTRCKITNAEAWIISP
ncbi:MAG: hypothetical protein IH589_07740 [Anaerolineales bacterium]|nr:hypothetical protein [Anaerolineales bacterium]